MRSCLSYMRKRRALKISVSGRARLILLAMVFALVLMAGILKGTRLIYAFAYTTEAPVEENVKCYRSVMIYLGDTVYSVAEENFGDGYDSVAAYAKEIVRINHIDIDTALIPGNYLVVPYFKPL